MELSELKPGDKVLMISGYRGCESIHEVEKIDRYGKIKLKGNEELFDKYGYRVTKERWSTPCRIEPIDEQGIEKIKEKWRRQKAINDAVRMCHNVREEDLTYKSAIEIIVILSGKRRMNDDV